MTKNQSSTTLRFPVALLQRPTVNVTIPGRKTPVAYPVSVRHECTDVSSGFLDPFDSDDPKAPEHLLTVVLTTAAYEIEESPRKAKALERAFRVVADTPGVVTTIANASASPVLEIASITATEFTERRVLETGEPSWFWYLDAFHDYASEVGAAVDALLSDGAIPDRFGAVRRVLYLDNLEVHPAFRGQYVGARLLMHAVDRLIVDPSDLCFAHAVPFDTLRYAGSAGENAPPAPSQQELTAVELAVVRRRLAQETTALATYLMRAGFDQWLWGDEVEEPGELRAVRTLGGEVQEPLLWMVGGRQYPARFWRDDLDDDVDDDVEDDVDDRGGEDGGGGVDDGPRDAYAAAMKAAVSADPTFDVESARFGLQLLRVRVDPFMSGIGRFPETRTVRDYTAGMAEVVEILGLENVLMVLREVILEMAPSRPIGVASKTWVADAMQAIAADGLERFLAKMIARLRVEFG